MELPPRWVRVVFVVLMLVVLGLLGLAYSVRFLEAVIERLFTRTFFYWQQLAV